MRNLKKGSIKSFIISHWMDAHESSNDPPEFEWKIVESYSDALRRQLCEGLYILEEGALNRKNEFNNNMICRMRAMLKDTMSEKELQKELEARKEYNDRLRSFVVKKSKKSSVFDCKGLSSSRRNKLQSLPQDSNDPLCCRYSIDQYLVSLPLKRKRKKNMETSTPVSGRRENKLIDLGEDSPIGANEQNVSSVTDDSGDIIPTTKVKAGLSNEVDILAVTPTKELSPDTMDKRLALHCVDIVKASVKNERVLELQEEEAHLLELSDNSFNRAVKLTKESPWSQRTKRSDVGVMVGAQGAGIVGINNTPLGKMPNTAAGMDGMNNTPLGENSTNGTVGMDGLNNDNVGGDGTALPPPMACDVDVVTTKGNSRKILIGGRRVSTTERPKKETGTTKLVLGKKATDVILGSRACPGEDSPKRPTPMDVDLPTTSKKKRGMNGKRWKTTTSRQILPSNQQKITDLWKDANKEDTE